MRRLWPAIATGMSGAAFVYALYLLGLSQMRDALGRIGWGFAAILLLSGLREAARALAWMRTLDPPDALSFRRAFSARLAGEALNTLLPMGFVVGEPTKAEHVADRLPFAAAFAALMLELAFYSASLALLFAAAGMALVSPLAALAIGGAGIAGALLLKRTALLRRLPALAVRDPLRASTILLLETSYHALGVAEVFVTLLLISPHHAALGAALVLEAANRGVTMLFKMLPMRMGVDEASAALIANRLALGSATGLTIALVRKLRLLFWSAVGLALIIVRVRKQAARRDAAPASALAQNLREMAASVRRAPCRSPQA